MEINNLKARAYDLIAGIEQAKVMLSQINQQIVEIQNKPQIKETEKENPKKEIKEEKKWYFI